MTEEPQVIYCVIASLKTFKLTSYVQYLVSLHTDLYSAWRKIEQLYMFMLPTLSNTSSTLSNTSSTEIRVHSNGFEVVYYDLIFNDYMSKDFHIETRPLNDA